MRRVLLLAALSLLTWPSVAHAVFPGENGKIAFTRNTDGLQQIYVINPDGTGETNISNSSTSESGPAWSPDGTKLMFVRGPQLWVMNADGTGKTLITTDAYSRGAWSPDGTRIVFRRSCLDECTHLVIANADGSGEAFVPNSFWSNGRLRWSNDGTRIAYGYNPSGEGSIVTIRPDGTDAHVVCCAPGGDNPGPWGPDWSPDDHVLVMVRFNRIYRQNLDGTGGTYLRPMYDYQPAWSPDGTKIAFNGSSSGFGVDGIHTMNADGSGVFPVTTNLNDTGPDWQPILRGYPRPKGAGTLHAPLVPAYQPCASPNRVHASPLSYNSCNPPTRTSTQLTLGTPDANGTAANSIASLRIGVIPGNTGTPADEAEANLITSVTDVRNAGDLTDYTGNLEVRVPLEITDKSNSPYPGGPGPGTVVPFTLTWSVPCTATADPKVGANCSLFTTADTLLPGSALEGRRAIWQTDQIEVRDGAGQPFLRQGIFLP